NVSPKKLVKTLLYKADDQIIAALIRGDQELNEVKLKNLVGAKNLEMADAATVEKITGAKVGFSGPVGLKNLKIIADLQISKLKNAVTGANENDFHLTDVNFKRDFKADQIADIRNVVSGEICPHCKKGKLTSSYGIEVGNTFMLGTKYSESLGAKFLDKDGNEKPFVMGSYGIGITRTAQAAVEKFNDDKGIIWPNFIAPFSVVITPTDWNNDKIKSKALEIYEHLIERNIATLLDDRDERPGVKFNDADLIGIPLRVTLGPKNLEKNQIEIQIRKTKETIHVPPAEAVAKCQQLLENL
ncbi:MAG TPA: YbaK/EbsC family protein, partial [candidate division Zixibacteria bacterium]|nr:YbaK/EbsC family protein [candidate division Zixibacteria bacterium]